MRVLVLAQGIVEREIWQVLGEPWVADNFVFACPTCYKSLPKIKIHMYSTNGPYGMRLVAHSCAGLGWWAPAQSSMADFQLSKL